MQNKVKITLFGDLGKKVGKNWNLAVESVGEAIRFIEHTTKKKLYKYLLEKDKEGIRYRVLINNRDFVSEKPLDVNDLDTVRNSELVMKRKDLKTIDIIPVIEGADDGGIFATILGALLIVVGVILLFTPFAPLGTGLIIAGLGLVAAGVTVLLSQPPDFQPFQEIEGGGAASYLFNGPQNTTREGGPVPVGYGRLLIGSQVISASYDIIDYEALA